MPNVKVGDRVCVEAMQRCSKCVNCLSGHTNLCVLGPAAYGLTGLGGGLAEKVVVPFNQVYKLPDNLPIEYGALVEPIAVAWHAVELSGIKPGMTALVLGAGPIGIAVIICLQAMGAKTVIVSEPATARRKQAENFDVDYALNPMEVDVISKVKEIVNGEGVDRTYDCSGVQATFQASIDALAASGVAMNIATWTKPALYNPTHALNRERVLMASCAYISRDFNAVLKAIEDGRLKGLDKMVTAKIPMKNTVSVGFDGLINHKDKHIKILCSPIT